MSDTRLFTENFTQAAARHLADARLLLNEGRWDNAVYHAGYVLECILKCIVNQFAGRTNAIDFGHQLMLLQGEGLARLRSIYPLADLLVPIMETQHTVLEAGHPERRYASHSLWTEAQARAAVDRVDELYQAIITRFILDGYFNNEEW